MSDTPAAANIGEDPGSTGSAGEGKQAWEARAVAPALAKHPERREAFASTSGMPARGARSVHGRRSRRWIRRGSDDGAVVEKTISSVRNQSGEELS
jgi:hypothetical protein